MIHCITLSSKTAGSKLILCLTLTVTIKSSIKDCSMVIQLIVDKVIN